MDYGVAGTALASGILFGYVLEQAGFGSPCKLTAQFRLTDWSVFKVMFTAILVASLGILLLQSGNYFGSTGFFVPTTFFWATAVGAALIGAGFAVGGYCPGTSVVGFMSGRIDGLVFMLGMVLGILVFASIFNAPITQSILHTAQISAKTIPQWLGVSPWIVWGAMVVMAIAGFWLGRMMEQRSHGVLTADDIVESIDPTLDSAKQGSAVDGNLGEGSVPLVRGV
ncbi:MAG: DUF6691 family protein, partial [Halothiobacillus sp.]